MQKLLGALAFICSMTCSFAHAAELRFVNAEPVTLAAADAYYPTRVVSAVAPPTAANSDAEIHDAARALNADVDNIYEFVRNNVHFEPTFGQQKGALGTLVDRSGNGFDQSNLFVALVRAGGGTARLVYGTVTLTGAEFAEWFELTNARAACELLGAGGIPGTINGTTNCASLSGNVTQAIFRHVWAQAQIDGTWYSFDPARKIYQRFAPMDLAAAMSYTNVNALLSAAGGTASTLAGSPTRNNLTATGVNPLLTQYSTNLINSLRNQGYDSHIEQISGGRRLIPWRSPIGGLRQTSLNYASTVATWTDVPDAYRATFRIRVNSIQDGTGVDILDRVYFADQIYGRRMTIDRWTPDGDQATLRIDGITVQTFDRQGLGFFPDVNTTMLALTADHPYAANSGALADETVTRGPSGMALSLAIIHGWGASSADLAAKLGSERMYDNHRLIGRSGDCNSTRPPDEIFSNPQIESLANMQLGYTWLAQYVRASELAADIGRARRVQHHMLGVVGFAQTWRDMCETYPPEPGRPFLPQVMDSGSQIDMHSAASVVHETADAAERSALQFTIASAAATLEGSVAEQLQSTAAPASTVERYEWQSSQSPSSRFALSTSANFPALAAATALSGEGGLQGYAATGMSAFAVEGNELGPGVPEGARIPTANGYYNASSLERGTAFSAFSPDASHIIHKVSTGPLVDQSAGGGSTPNPSFNAVDAGQVLAQARERREQLYGVSRETGDLTIVAPADISVGPGAPYGLTFQRTFSGGSAKTRGLAAGWTHNWDYGVEMSGSALSAMGEHSVVSAASSLAAIFVTLDLYRGVAGGSDQAALQRHLAAFWTQHWWREYLQFNVATVTRGGRSEAFVRLPNGQFNAPPGAELTLTQFGARRIDFVRNISPPIDDPTDVKKQYYDDLVWFRLRTPTGEEIDFRHYANLSGSGAGTRYVANPRPREFLATQMRTSFGVTTNFTYTPGTAIGAGMLTNVQNSVGRSLTFQYSTVSGSRGDDRLTGVEAAGDAGVRTASFVYDTTSSPQDANPYSQYADLSEQFDPEQSNAPLLLEAIASDNARTRYEYVFPNPGQPDPAAFVGAPRNDWRPRPRRLYTANSPTTAPRLTFVHSRDGRVDSATNTRNNTWAYRTIPHARSAHVDPIGSSDVALFSLSRHENVSRDAMNRRTIDQIDGLGRVVDSRLGWHQTGYADNRYEQRRSFLYDRRSNVLEERRHPRTDASGAPLPGPILTRTREYNNATWPTQVTRDIDEEGRARSFTYHATTGLLTREAGPANEQTDYTYNGVGLPETATVRVSASSSRLTQWTYDSFGQVTEARLRHPSNAAFDIVHSFAWTPAGNLLRITDPRGGISEGTYDAARRLLTLIAQPSDSARRRTTAFTYNAEGETTAVRRGVVSNPSLANDADWLIDRFDYDQPGLLTRHRDPSDDATSFEYDARDWFFAEVDATSLRTETLYASTGEISCIRRAVDRGLAQSTRVMSISIYATPDGYWPARGSNDNCGGLNNSYRTVLEFDAYGRTSRTIFPNGSDVVQTFDGTDQPETNETRAGQLHTFTYDTSGRVHTRTTPEGVYTLNYDDEGKKTNEAYAPPVGYPTSPRNVAFAYDYAGRLASETPSDGVTPLQVQYLYDRVGNRTAVRWPDAWTARYVYDLLGRMIEVWTDPDGNAACASTPDACGNGVSGNGDETLIAAFSYDRVGRLTRREHGGSGGSGVSRMDITYEPDSDVATVTHTFSGSSAAFEFDYDAAGRLTGEDASSPGWLWLANIGGTDTYAVASTIDQYPTVAGQSLAWDLNANLASWGSRTFTYDSENRLRTANVNTVASAYEYDPSGRRVSRTVGGTATRFLHAGNEEIGEYSGAGLLTRRFVPGAGVDQPVAFVDAGGARVYPHANRQGSILALANSAGLVQQRYLYDPYGREAGPPSPDSNPWRFTGRRYDAETGLYYYRARYYSPDLGRFLQTDPVGYRQSLNLYQYAMNAPLGLFDPSGMTATVYYDDNGNVRINLDVKFAEGSGTPEEVAGVIRQMESTWTGQFGQYNVVTTVTQVTTDGPMTNNVELFDTATPRGENGHSNVLNNYDMQLSRADMAGRPVNGTDADNPNTVGHETGHLFGLEDTYRTPRAQRERWMNNNIMDRGGRVTEENIRDILANEPFITPDGVEIEPNQLIHCPQNMGVVGVGACN